MASKSGRRSESLKPLPRSIQARVDRIATIDVMPPMVNILQGLEPDWLEWLAADPQAQDPVREALIETFERERGYVIEIDPTLSFKQRLRLGKYKKVDPDINENNFGLHTTGKGPLVRRRIKLYRLPPIMEVDSNIVTESIEVAGGYSSDMDDALAFGSDYSIFNNRDAEIVFAGARYHGDEDNDLGGHVVVLDCFHGKKKPIRRLKAYHIDALCDGAQDSPPILYAGTWPV